MSVDGNPFLRLTELTVDFASQEGTVHAVNHVGFEVAPGELVGMAGERSCGRGITASAIIGLSGMVPNAAVSSSIEFDGRGPLTLPRPEQCSIRSRDIAMLVQDPITGLNRVLSIEGLMTESLELHLCLSHGDPLRRQT